MPTLDTKPKPSAVDLPQLINRLPGMIAVYNVNSGTYVFVNSAVKTILGYSPAQFENGGTEFAVSLIHPDDLPGILEENQAILDQANTSQPLFADNEPIMGFEYRMRHADGHWVWLHTKGSVYDRTPSGLVDHVLNISIDITGRKETEANLQNHSQDLEKRLEQRTERLELALEASKVGTWEWNIETGQLIWSPEMMELYGMEPNTEVTVDKFFNALHPDDREMKKQVLGSAVQSGLPYEVEHRCVWSDGSIHWIMGRGKALTKNGKAYRMVGTAMNVDERKELVRLNKAKDEFIALASHQLRTPATGVKQFLGMVLEGYAGNVDAEQKSMLQQAYESNERQIRIIDSLLLVARVDAGKVIFTRKACDIVQLIREVIDEQKAAFAKRRQTITLDVPKSLKAMVDPRYIRMVIENIISNAGKYSVAGKPIKVTAKRVGRRVVLSIQDYGVGISRADQQKLYQKFMRIDNPLSTAAGGNGLGLYWSKKIIDAHGGTIELVSKPRRGSTFTLTLPV